MREGSDLDLIIEHIQGGDLPPRLELRFERLNLADDVLRQYGNVKAAAPILYRAIRFKYYLRGIPQKYSLKTAYQDLADTQTIYRRPTQKDINWHLDNLMAWIAENRRIALKKKDLQALAENTRMKLKAINLLRGDDDKTIEDFQVPQMIYLFKPELLNLPMIEGEQLKRELEELQRTESGLLE